MVVLRRNDGHRYGDGITAECVGYSCHRSANHILGNISELLQASR
jgi:hypothetical protein